MAKCIVCGCELREDNCSEEHIILNAIGGHLKSMELLCKEHNSAFGDECDAELAKQLQVLSSHFQVHRQRGKNPEIEGTTSSGKSYKIIDGRTPVLTKPTVEVGEVVDGVRTVHIEARTEKELRQILQGIKKKYPGLQIDIEEVVANGEHVAKRLDESVNFNLTVGGFLAFRSIVKTAVEYYVIKTGDVETVKPLIPYLKGEEEKNIVRIYTTQQPVYELEPGDVCHVIHLESNVNERLLYAYVEFYSVFSFVVLLSDNYNGAEVNETYCFELNTVGEKAKSINLGLTKESLDINHIPGPDDWSITQQRCSRFLSICESRQMYFESCDILKQRLKGISGLSEEDVNGIAEDVGKMMARILCD